MARTAWRVVSFSWVNSSGAVFPGIAEMAGGIDADIEIEPAGRSRHAIAAPSVCCRPWRFNQIAAVFNQQRMSEFDGDERQNSFSSRKATLRQSGAALAHTSRRLAPRLAAALQNSKLH